MPKPSGSYGGKPPPRGMAPQISGRKLRKEKRKEERAASKKRAAPVVPNFEGHDSDVRSSRRRVELFVEALRRTITKEEEGLKEWKPPKTPEQLEAERLKKRGSGLRGAAKPAWEKYPELYPEMHKEEPEEPTFDLISKHSPNCFSQVETKALVGHYFQLGHAILANDNSKTKGRDAQEAFKKSLELDKSDPFGSRYGYLLASLERGEVVEEWSEILNEDFVKESAEAMYLRALFIKLSADASDDEDKGQDNTEDEFLQALSDAVGSFPETAMALIHQDLMSIVADPGLILGWIRGQRESLVVTATEDATPNRLAGLCDVGICSSSLSSAVCFYICFGQYWTDPDLQEALAGLLGDDVGAIGDREEPEDEPWAAKDDISDERSIDRALRRMYIEAAKKF